MREPLKFAMPKQAPKGLFRRTPPAVFPPILGLLGLALAWRAGVTQFALPQGLSGLLDGVAVALFAFAALAYGVKLARRPAVLKEELRLLPGRAGTAAAVLSVYLSSGVLAPYGLGSAKLLLVVGFVLHTVLLVVLLRVYAAGPAELRRVTPVWHLNWVGFIVAAAVAPMLGWPALALAIFWPALLSAGLIWAVSARQLLAERVPAPLRPLLAIHAAPLALLGTVAVLNGYVAVGQVVAALSGLALLAGLLGARWLTESGFSALWGAFTFPIAATAGLFWALHAAAPGDMLRLVAGVVLIVATLVVIPIVFLVMRDWARGRLAVKTNAAIA